MSCFRTSICITKPKSKCDQATFEGKVSFHSTFLSIPGRTKWTSRIWKFVMRRILELLESIKFLIDGRKAESFFHICILFFWAPEMQVKSNFQKIDNFEIRKKRPKILDRNHKHSPLSNTFHALQEFKHHIFMKIITYMIWYLRKTIFSALREKKDTYVRKKAVQDFCKQLNSGSGDNSRTWLNNALGF